MQASAPSGAAAPGFAARSGLAAAVALLTTALVLVTATLDFPHLTTSQELLTGLLILVGMVPCVVHLYRPTYSMPLFALHGLFYVASFGVTTLAGAADWFRIDESAKTAAIGYVLLGLLALNAGYAVGPAVTSPARRLTRHFPVVTGSQERIGWLGAGLYAVGVIMPSLKAIPSVTHVLDATGMFGVVLLLRAYWAGVLSRWSAAGLFGVYLPLIVLNGFVSGSLAEVLLIALLAGTVYWEARQRVPWVMILLTAAFLYVLNPIKHDYRREVWFGDRGPMSTLQKAGLFADIAEDRYLRERAVTGALDTNLARVSHMHTMAWVVALTPDHVPYWNGETFMPLVVALVPRALYPDKPKASFGGEFGRRYGLLANDNLQTAFNIPWVVEFYANFGLTGVLAGMFLCGVLFRALLEIFARPETSATLSAAGLATTYSLFYAESNFALMWGGLLLKIAVIALFVKGVEWLRRPV